MRMTWVTRSFLDYRVPVFAELNRLCGNQLTLIYFSDIVPERVQEKVKVFLGERAVGLTGEYRISGQKEAPVSSCRRGGVRIPLQPGLIGKLRESKPDVMISDGFFQWTYAPLWIRMWKKIPHVMCYEPTPHTERNAQWYRTLYRKCAAHWIDAICCNGSLCREYTLSLGYPPERIFTGQMAADSGTLAEKCRQIPEEERNRFRTERKYQNTVFLYVGRLVELKGILPLLKAWGTADHQATLLLAGDGPQRQEIGMYCRDHHLQNVILAGNQDYDAIAAFYRMADVFIIPTLQDNWSLVVPEAMACGLPVACSKYNGCHPELVHPDNGWVFDPLNTEETEKMLKTILEKRKDLAVMGQRSREIVRDFSPEHAASSIMNAVNYASHNKFVKELCL